MEIWLDTCEASLIEQATSLGLLYGVTTNPSILQSSLSSPIDTLQMLLNKQQGPVTMQVTATTCKEMVAQGLLLHRINPRVLIKIPASLEGLQAIALLSKQHIPIMATVIYSRVQALNAIKAGATYVALYVGRMEQEGLCPEHTLRQLVECIHHDQLPAKVMAASIRSHEHIQWCLDARCHAVTLGKQAFKLWTEVPTHTMRDIAAFTQALPANWLQSLSVAERA